MMQRRSFIRIGAMAAGMAGLSAHAVRAKKPNILFIFSDDHAQRTIGAYGSGLHNTPNIDRIAEEGAVFKNSFCCNSICQPSRAAILTGKHSHLNGMMDNGNAWDGTQKVFTRELKKAGYQTALRGKWHMVPAPSKGEFDSWEILDGFGHQGCYYKPIFLGEDGEFEKDGYSTDVITDRAIEWMERDRDPNKPFLMMCQYKAPHVPRMPHVRYLDRYKDVEFPEPETLLDDYEGRPHLAKHWMPVGGMDSALNIFDPDDPMGSLNKAQKKYFQRMTKEESEAYFAAYEDENRDYYQRVKKGELSKNGRKKTVADKKYRYQRFIKDYLRIVEGVDDNVGRLLQWLDDNGLAENTIVVYSSDQDYFTGEHYMAEKRWMYEQGLRMPFVIRWPGVIKPGSQPEAMIQNIDYAPTFLEAAGLVPPREMQGRSLLPVLAGKTPKDWRKSVYYHYYAHGKHNVPRHDGVRTGRFKLMHFYTDDVFELYDLKEDPNEVKNLINDPEYKSVRMKLEKELNRLRKHYDVPEKAFETPYL
ncbi:Arylsulfatase [Pontiella desulfatans]|uniref:Arylsulfatase n=1 Tax=Pontiella desulfatans TaxID=2750659 RepID=A0A6C2TZP0_PONDE|nr:sulfatase [Pontiella desulfatans]SPS73731.1 sulfatase S1_11 [Kiritimatiellales bacterium]VGO13073.1 Arylsulfatase [Pontiella desulfatans]